MDIYENCSAIKGSRKSIEKANLDGGLMQALIKTDLWIDIHVFFDLELIINIVRFLTSVQGVDINHTLVEGALIVTNRNTILLEPRKGLGSKEGRKIFIGTSAVFHVGVF